MALNTQLSKHIEAVNRYLNLPPVQQSKQVKQAYIQALSWKEQPMEKLPSALLSNALMGVKKQGETSVALHSRVVRVALRAAIQRRTNGLTLKGLKAGDTVAVVGRTNLDMDNLEYRLAAFGVHFSSFVSEETTHIVLGMYGKEYHLSGWKDRVWMRDFELHQYLVNQKNTAENAALQTNIEQLLTSLEVANIELAYQLLMTIGLNGNLAAIVALITRPRFRNEWKGKALIPRRNLPPRLLRKLENLQALYRSDLQLEGGN